MDGTGNAVQGGQGTSPINNDGVTDVEYSEVGSGTPQAQTSAASGDVPMSDTNGSSHAPHPLTSFERNGINSEDTLPSALRKAVANTRPVRKAESYKNQLGVAYNIGKNTAREQMPTLPKPPPVDTYVVNVVEPKPQNSSTATGAPLLPGNNTLVNPDE